LIDNGIAVLENERIEAHIMKFVPGGHNLFVPDKEIEKKIENLYNKFKLMILKRDENSKQKVISILQVINDSLKDKGSRFLTG
jgi:chloride intracellular channel protein 2